MSAPIAISAAGEVTLANAWAPTPASAVRALATRKGKGGDARVYLRPEAQKATARPAGQISVEGSGAHHANNHNARLWRDVPLLVATGVTPLMNWQDGTARVAAIREGAERSNAERLASEEAAFAAAVAAVAAIDPDAAVVLALHARWRLPLIIAASKLKRDLRRLRAGRTVTELVNARHWLPTSDVPSINGEPVAALRYWTGDIVVFGSARDPEARAACDAAFAAAVAFVETCAPLVEEPLRPTFGPKGIPRRHRVVMRHLRERAPLPRAQ